MVIKRFHGSNWIRVKKTSEIHIDCTGFISQPKYMQSFDPSEYLDVHSKLSPNDFISTPAYSFVIE
jgi:hypothetical protein